MIEEKKFNADNYFAVNEGDEGDEGWDGNVERKTDDIATPK
jgi:hypothetical protein